MLKLVNESAVAIEVPGWIHRFPRFGKPTAGARWCRVVPFADFEGGIVPPSCVPLEPGESLDSLIAPSPGLTTRTILQLSRTSCLAGMVTARTASVAGARDLVVQFDAAGSCTLGRISAGFDFDAERCIIFESQSGHFQVTPIR